MAKLSDIVAQAMAVHNRGDVESAAALFEQLLKASPGEPVALEYLGVQAAKAGDHERAIALYRQGLDHSRCRPSMHFQLGHALRDSGKPAAAASAYEKYLDLEQDPNGTVSLADIHFSQDDFGEAKRVLLLALDWQPDHTKALCLLAKTEEFLGADDAARTRREQALASPDAGKEVMLLKACACLDLGDTTKAFETASPAINALFDDDFEAAVDQFSEDSINRDLPEIQGSAPLSSDKPLLMAAGDPVYVSRFAPELIRSVAQKSPSVDVHIHVIAAEETYQPLERDLRDHSVSWEVDGQAGSVTFASRRFVRAAQWRRNLSQPLIIIDLDSVVNNDIKQALNELPDFDVAMRHRQEEIFIHQRVAAGFLALALTAEAQVFVDSVAAYIRHFEHKGTASWFVDQMALLAARLRLLDKGDQVRIVDVPRQYLDWSGHAADSVIWTAKGAAKTILTGDQS